MFQTPFTVDGEPVLVKFIDPKFEEISSLASKIGNRADVMARTQEKINRVVRKRDGSWKIKCQSCNFEVTVDTEAQAGAARDEHRKEAGGVHDQFTCEFTDGDGHEINEMRLIRQRDLMVDLFVELSGFIQQIGGMIQEPASLRSRIVSGREPMLISTFTEVAMKFMEHVSLSGDRGKNSSGGPSLNPPPPSSPSPAESA